MQMAGPVGDASSSDQTAGGKEAVPETPQKCFPAGRFFKRLEETLCVTPGTLCSSEVDIKTT